MPRSYDPCRAEKQIRQRLLCWADARSEPCELSIDRLPQSEPTRGKEPKRGSGGRSSTLLRTFSARRDVSAVRDYRLRVRRLEVGLEIEIERAKRELRLELNHNVPLIVGEPKLGVSILGEDSLRLDDWLDHDRVECARWNVYSLPAQHANPYRIPVGPEIAVEVVGLADFERDGANEVEERPIIEWLADGLLLFHGSLGRLNEHCALGINLESALDVLSTFLELLVESQRRQGLCVHPALVHIVHAVQEIAALHPECGVPHGPATKVVQRDDFNVRVANSARADLAVEVHALAWSERNLRALDRRRYDSLGTCGRNRTRRLRPGAGGRCRDKREAGNERLFHAGPPAGAARRRALRAKRKRLSASATGRTLVSRVRTS